MPCYGGPCALVILDGSFLGFKEHIHKTQCT
jgi:hypothetical protein